MAVERPGSLLGANEPHPVRVDNAKGLSPFLIVGDHAGRAIPNALGTLGLASEDQDRHIAWDIGVRGLGQMLATKLDAAFIAQHYSRLVIDCNRDPFSTEAVPTISDRTSIPGNLELSKSDRARRVDSLHEPYHARIASVLTERIRRRRRTIFLALHSFTPNLNGSSRPWDVGIMHWKGETGFAGTLLETLRRSTSLCVGNNEPYAMDVTDYTVPRHCFPLGIQYAEIEVRQDLIADLAGQQRLACLLGQTLLELPLAGNAS